MFPPRTSNRDCSGAVNKALAEPIVDDRTEEMSALLAALTASQGRRHGPSGLCTGPGCPEKPQHAFNSVVEQTPDMANELARLRQVVGKEGKLKQRVSLSEARGFWGESIECINSLIDDLVHPMSEVARVIGAVAQGDLSKSMALEIEGRALEGEFLRTAKTINTHGGPARLVRLGSHARRPRSRAPKASWAARPRSRAWPARGRT